MKNESIGSPRAQTPTHLWIVGAMALLWNAVGAFDYLATQLQLEGYMSQFTAEQLAFFEAIPAWAVAAWAIAVWAALFGSVALLLRRRIAYTLFLVSLAAMLVSTLNTFILSDGAAVMGGGGVVFSGLIVAIGVLLLWYSKIMVERGVLR
ncbi:MAG TPA: hypothetical protein VKA17_05980 [Gammaproteobacteria bacterium]|nr:hypothetical protein [Gammaproteobacteria bacterium]